MNFKWTIACLICISIAIMAYPQRTPEETAIQDALTHTLNQNPRDVDARFELAMEYAATGWIELGWNELSIIPKLAENYENVVLKKYGDVIAKNPNDWKAHFRLAFAHYFKDDKAAAIESFKQVLIIQPDHVWSMGLIALLMGEQKKYDDCISWSKRALKINDDALAIHFLLGKAYYETGNFFGTIGESLSVARIKSVEAKYRPIPPKGLE